MLVTDPLRNRQVSGSSPLVGSILSSTCESVCCDPLESALLSRIPN